MKQNLVQQLQEKVEKTVRETLRPARDRIQAASPQSQSDLADVQQQLADLRGQVAALESASPVQLVQRKLTPERAVEAINGLTTQIAKLAEKESSLRADVSFEEASVATDFSSLRKAIQPLCFQTETLLGAQIACMFVAMTDSSRMDPFWELEQGRFSHFISSTVAGNIASDRVVRSRRINSNEDLLALVDEILVEPIPELMRSPAELPTDRDKRMVDSIYLLLEADQEEADTPPPFNLPAAEPRLSAQAQRDAR